MKVKTTLAAREFKQREGLGSGRIFVPTIPSFFVHILGAIAYELYLDACHFDVK